MAYQRGMSPQPSGTVLTVEQARRRNAELRLALVAITAENVQLETKLETMRRDVTAARRKLSKKIRDLDAIRSQTTNIAALADHVTGEEPVHGGPEGLQAAAVRPGRKGPSHGTGRRYGVGCRCDACLGWRDRKSAQTLEGMRRKRERDIEEALRAHGVEVVA